MTVTAPAQPTFPTFSVLVPIARSPYAWPPMLRPKLPMLRLPPNSSPRSDLPGIPRLDWLHSWSPPARRPAADP